MYKLADNRTVRPSETALALNLLSEMELLRLKTIARLHARGLPPDVGWDDLLQEAVTRVLTGARPRPKDVPLVAFIAGIMRSLKSEHWRRVSNRSRRITGLRLSPTRAAPREPASEAVLQDPAPDPERSLMAVQELAEIHQLFADDPVALQIIAGLGEGLTPEQIRGAGGLSKTDYDSARRRMRRGLLREGLTCNKK
jgi:DNA-directed RNA polymerase specialized sigma24 family protein